MAVFQYQTRLSNQAGFLIFDHEKNYEIGAPKERSFT